MSIQPAEFAKLGVVTGHGPAARGEDRSADEGDCAQLRDTRRAGARWCSPRVPAALIMAQPDLGTMLVLSATVFGLIAVAGAPKRWLFGLVAVRRRRRPWRPSSSAC